MFLVTSGWCWNIFMWQMAYVRESVKLASGLRSSIRGSAQFPSIKPRTCFSLSWHLWIRSVFSSFDPLRNVSIKLSASFNPVFKMLSLSMKSTHVPGVTVVKWAPSRILRSLRLHSSTLSHTPKIETQIRDHKLCYQLCREQEVVCQHSCLESPLPRPVTCIVIGFRDAAERLKMLNFRHWLWLIFTTNFPTETLKIRWCLYWPDQTHGSKRLSTNKSLWHKVKV